MSRRRRNPTPPTPPSRPRQRLAKEAGSLPPPKIILNAPTKLMKGEGYGEGYRYDHDEPEGFSGQNYFPDAPRPAERSTSRWSGASSARSASASTIGRSSAASGAGSDHVAVVETRTVTADEDGMRLDRWFKTHFPDRRLRPSAKAPALRAGPARRRRAPRPMTASPPARPCACRPCRQQDSPGAPAVKRHSQADRDAAFLRDLDPARGSRRPRHQQAAWPGRAGRLGHGAPCRRHAGSACGPRRREAAPRPSARPRHLRRARPRQDPQGRLRPRRDLPHALGPQDLLGPGQGRAEPQAGAHLALPLQAARPRRRAGAGHEAWRRGSRAFHHLLFARSTGRRTPSPGCR